MHASPSTLYAFDTLFHNKVVEHENNCFYNFGNSEIVWSLLFVVRVFNMFAFRLSSDQLSISIKTLR